MDLRFITEGLKFTLYGLDVGDDCTIDFLEDLKVDNVHEYDRIIKRLEHLANRGPSRRITEFNTLGNGLYEAKSSGGARVVFFYIKGSIVICACGFPKKKGKTPKRILKKAKARKLAFEEYIKSGKEFEIVLSEDVDEPRRIP